VSVGSVGCHGQQHSPVSLLFLERRNAQELIDGLLGAVGLHLLGIVVFVLDVDVAALVLIFIFVLEIVAG
jgi:hypothetical protein